MKLESTFHSGKTLYKISQRRHLQSMTGPTCLRNQRASLTRCDDSKRMYLPGIMTSPIYKIHEWAIGRGCKINILEWQNLHWGRDSSTTASSWYFQTFKFPHSLHIRGARRSDTYHMWATSWLWVDAICFFACKSAFFGSRRNAFVRPVIKPQFSIAPDNVQLTSVIIES